MDYIYKITPISLKELSLEEINEKYEKKKEKHPKLSFKTFKHLEYPYGNYDTYCFDSGFYEDIEIARKTVINNVCDIFETGSYYYVVISRITLNVSYYDSYQRPDEDFEVFRFNINTKRYELLDKDSSEYKALIYCVWGYVGF